MEIKCAIKCMGKCVWSAFFTATFARIPLPGYPYPTRFSRSLFLGFECWLLDIRLPIFLAKPVVAGLLPIPSALLVVPTPLSFVPFRMFHS